jgi:hypothetical protein
LPLLKFWGVDSDHGLAEAARVAARVSGGQSEQLVDELILTSNIRSAHPSNLSLPHHVDRFITLNRSSRRLELAESLLGVHSSLGGAVVLLDDVVQVLHGPVPAATTALNGLALRKVHKVISRRFSPVRI